MALGHLSVQQSWFNLGFGGVRLGLYPPWTAGLLWTLWFGWGYGAVITFVCALALSLLAGLGGWSVPVALADSTGLGVLFIFLRGFPIDPRLGAWRDRGIFAAAVFFASVAGGCGALVVGLATGMSRVEVLNLWQGWWLGHAAEGLLLAGGIAMAFGRSVERWKEDWFNLRHPSATFRRQVAAAVVAGVSAIAFYTAWTHEAGMSVLEEIYGAVSHDAARERLLEAYGRAHFQHGLVIASLLGALAWGVVMLLILRRRYQDQLRDEVNRTTAALRRRHLQLVALQALTESLSRSQDPREIAARLAEHSARLIEPGAVTVYLRDADQPGRLKLASRHAGGIPEPHPEPPEELKAGASLAGHVLEKNEVVVLDRDAAAHPLAGASAGFLKALEAQAYIGVPISGKAARRGVFELVLCRSYRREDEELRLFRLIGQSVGAALERAERHVRAQRRADALEALGQLTKDLAGASETEPLLERFADGARRLLNAQALGVALEDPAPGGGLRLAAVSAAPGVEAPAAGARWPREAAPLLDACLNAGEPQSVGLEPAASESVEIAPGWNAQALLLAPLPGREPAQGGVLVAVFAPDEAQGEEALELVEELARQCAAGLRRVGLLDATRRQTAEIALFEQIGRAFAGHLNARETLRILVRNVEKIVPAEWGGVLRYEPGAEQLAVETTTIPHPEAQEVRIPLDAQALVCACFREGRTLVSADMRNDPRANPELSARFGSGSGVFVPLGSARARFGVLFAMSAAARGFDAEDVRRLEQVAALAAAALERARLYDEVQHRADELALLHEAGQILVETPLLETSLRRIAEVVRVHFGVAGVGFLLADAARSKLTLAGLAVPKTGGLEGRSVPLDGPGPTATAFREARTVVLEDDAREAPSAWVRECLPGFRSGVVLPMPTAHGPVGVLGLFDTAPRAYSAEELSRLEAVARLAASAVERGALGRRLQASEARVQELLDGMPALVIGVDAGGTVTHFNAAAEHLFGWRRDEAVGRDAFALMHRDAREAAARREELRRVLSEGRAIAEAVIAVEPRAGAPRRVLWHLEPLHDAEGKIGGAVGMGLDVTERQALETQLHQAQKMESVGALAGGMAHDFNNLLGGILGQARLARAQLPAASELRATIEKIEAAAQRGADLTGKLLAFARTPVLQPRPVDLGALLDETADLLAGSLPGNIEIRRRIEPRLPVVHGDVTQLQQGPAEPLRQRPRRHAPGRDADPARARRGRADALRGRRRHRRGHGRARQGAPLRAVLHHQGTGQGDGPGARRRLRHRPQPRRRDRGPERSRRRRALSHPPSGPRARSRTRSPARAGSRAGPAERRALRRHRGTADRRRQPDRPRDEQGAPEAPGLPRLGRRRRRGGAAADRRRRRAPAGDHPRRGHAGPLGRPAAARTAPPHAEGRRDPDFGLQPRQPRPRPPGGRGSGTHPQAVLIGRTGPGGAPRPGLRGPGPARAQGAWVELNVGFLYCNII
ncbi:MAG: GAF domain-containing protein [Planctomycetota bacterium]|nr:GAF domain-containing protein [Planctomycetota bacterium]